MAFKEWFRKLRPMQLYIMLVLSTLFFAAELFISHVTHSLTLLVDSYHMLCNVIALVGCIFTIKKLHPESCVEDERPQDCEKIDYCDPTQVKLPKSKNELSEQGEKSLKNTFGWARIDILVMLIGSIFLASLCFSLLVEAVQTLVHIDHQDEIHYPITVLIVAAVGLLLNGFCYLLIGGYTFHQGSYLHVTGSGDVVLERAVTADSLRKGQRRLSSQSRRAAATTPATPPIRQSAREMIRDVIGCVFVIICASLVHFTSGLHYAKYLDPLISIISAICLLILSYPYMKESGLILLQTIPNDINIDSLRAQLLTAFPDIINVHDLHVWQMTADRIVSTAHIILLDPTDYVRINKEVTDFFNKQGITQVTIQAEFTGKSQKESFELLHKNPCLMQCLTDDCRRRHCCASTEDISEDLEKIIIKGEKSEIIKDGKPGVTKEKSDETLTRDSEKNGDSIQTIDGVINVKL